VDIRKLLFKIRGYAPIPFILVLLYQSDMTWWGVAIGLPLAIIGELIRLYSVRAAGGRTRSRNVGADKLCTWGPFTYVRNPLYLGNMLLYFGILLLGGGRWLLIIFIIALIYFTIQYSLIISLEEETLLKIYGERYEEYRSNVPRLIPRLRAWHKGNFNDKLKWKKTFRTERRTIQAFIIVISLILLKEILINILHVI
jgi:protein-S-isoprenylcysteine O-methyltransferase Ste14